MNKDFTNESTFIESTIKENTFIYNTINETLSKLAGMNTGRVIEAFEFALKQVTVHSTLKSDCQFL